MDKDIICIRPLTSKYLWGKLRSNKNRQIENPLHFSYSVKRSSRRHTWLQSMSAESVFKCGCLQFTRCRGASRNIEK